MWLTTLSQLDLNKQRTRDCKRFPRTKLRMARYRLSSIALFCLLFVVCETTSADIYFLSKTIGPSTNIYSVDEKGTVNKITDNTAWKDAEASFSNRGDLVFVSNRKAKVKADLTKTSEDYNIFKLAPAKKDIEQISFAKEIEHSPAISHNGKWVSYILRAGKYKKLMLLKLGESTPETLLIADNIGSIDWSSDDTKLAVVIQHQDNSTIELIDIATRERNILLRAYSQAPSDSPKSKGLFNTKSNQSALVNKIIISAQWSPDNTKIASIIGDTKKNVRELKLLDMQHNKLSAVSPTDVQVQYPISWSSDSAKIVYSGLVDYRYYFDEAKYKKVYEGAMHIYLTGVTGEKFTRQLTHGQALHNRPTFSPDDKRIAFLYGDNLGSRILALKTLSLDSLEHKKLYEKVAGNSFLVWR